MVKENLEAKINELRKKLEKEKENYKLLVDNTPDIIYTINPEGIFTFVSKAWTNILGHDVNETIGKSFKDFVHENDQYICENALVEVLKTGVKKENIEYRVKHLNGEWRIHNSNAIPLYENNNIIGFQGIASDITKNKELQKKALGNKSKFENYIMNSPVTVMITDNEGKYIFANPSACKHLNYFCEEITKLSVSDVILKEDNDKKNNKELIESLNGKKNLELQIKNKNNEIFDVLLDCKKLSEDEYISYIRDITNLKNYQQELINQKNTLQEVNDTKDKFFSILAHDLKSPLNSILGVSQILNDNYDDFSDEEKRKIFQDIANSTKNTYKLLEDLLEWAVASKSEEIYRPEKLELRKVICDVYKINQNMFEKYGINFKNLVYPNLFIEGDYKMTSTIFRNLIGNSIKYTKKDGSIILDAKEKENNYMVSIKDTGVGMDKHTLDNLFDISVKKHKDGIRGEKSTGLGLDLVKRYIEKQNGMINVESEIEKGTTFYLTFPKYKDGNVI
ncbi:MAG: PAS domain S-box protein [Candidatus Woesearchaeota archaeon]